MTIIISNKGLKMSSKIYGRIYMIVNLVNGKRYIGQTIRTIKTRFNGHINESKHNKNNMPIDKAIKKYGKERFVYGEICIAYSQKELNTLEGYYINLYKTFNKNIGYNIRTIDKNGSSKLSKETRLKLKEAHTKPKRKQIAINSGKQRRGKSHPNSISKYVGVTRCNKKYWSAFVHINNKSVRLGTYNTQEEAAQARDLAELKNIGDNAILNFPELKEQYLLGMISPQKRIRGQNIISNKKSNSQVIGVSFNKRINKWQVTLKGFKQKRFKTQQEAELYAIILRKNRASTS